MELGAHLGFWNAKELSWVDGSSTHTILGVDGILGLEYTFDDAPICLSLDWKPFANLGDASGFWGDGGGFSVRYIFQ